MFPQECDSLLEGAISPKEDPPNGSQVFLKRLKNSAIVSCWDLDRVHSLKVIPWTHMMTIKVGKASASEIKTEFLESVFLRGEHALCFALRIGLLW